MKALRYLMTTLFDSMSQEELVEVVTDEGFDRETAAGVITELQAKLSKDRQRSDGLLKQWNNVWHYSGEKHEGKFPRHISFWINQDIAKQILEAQPYNRDLITSNIKYLKEQMLMDEYSEEAGIPFFFNAKTGQLADGQNRLNAFIQAVDEGYKPVLHISAIITEVENLYDKVDHGKNRLPHEAIGYVFQEASLPKSVKQLVSNAAFIVHGYQTNKLSLSAKGWHRRNDTTQKDRIEICQQDNEALLVFGEQYDSLKPPATRILKKPMWAAAHAILNSISSTEAGAFMEKLLTMAKGDQTESEVSQPIKMLFSRLYKEIDGQATEPQKLAWVIKAWNAERTGNELGSKHFKAIGDFPKAI